MFCSRVLGLHRAPLPLLFEASQSPPGKTSAGPMDSVSYQCWGLSNLDPTQSPSYLEVQRANTLWPFLLDITQALQTQHALNQPHHHLLAQIHPFISSLPLWGNGTTLYPTTHVTNLGSIFDPFFSLIYFSYLHSTSLAYSTS